MGGVKKKIIFKFKNKTKIFQFSLPRIECPIGGAVAKKVVMYTSCCMFYGLYYCFVKKVVLMLPW